MPKGIFQHKKHTEETKKQMSLAKVGKKEDKANSWKGDKVGYQALHIWVRNRLGKPSLCAYCETTKAKLYDWANISKAYKRDLSDWIRLCRKCHMDFDRGRISLKSLLTG